MERWAGSGGIGRHAAFVALNGALASGAAYGVWRSLPPLRSESPLFLFVPLTVLSVEERAGNRLARPACNEPPVVRHTKPRSRPV